MRHAHAGHRDRRYEPVDDRPPGVGGERPKDRCQREGEDRGARRENKRVGEGAPDFSGYWTSGRDRGPEVAAEHHPQPAQKLDRQRLVKAVIGFELDDKLLRRLGRQDCRYRVARRDVDEHKHQQGDTKRDRGRVQDAPDEVDQHPAGREAAAKILPTVWAAARTCASSKRRPTSCNPTGSPLGLLKPGTATQGTWSRVHTRLKT